jgi:hypothetical protein
MPAETEVIEVGTKVRLKVCPHGEPGTVVRMERNRAVVLWHDLDYLARHQPTSLAEVAAESPEKSPQFSQETELPL